MKIVNVNSQAKIFKYEIVNLKRSEINNDEQTITDPLNLSANIKLSAPLVQLAKTYNVRSITESEVAELAKNLKHIGAINTNECAVMSFPHREARIREGAEINLDEKFDFLDVSQKRLEFSKSKSASPYAIEIQVNNKKQRNK